MLDTSGAPVARMAAAASLGCSGGLSLNSHCTSCRIKRDSMISKIITINTNASKSLKAKYTWVLEPEDLVHVRVSEGRTAQQAQLERC